MPLRNARHLLLAAVAVSLAWGSRPAAAAVPCAGDVSGAGRGTYYTYTPGTGACTFTGDDTDIRLDLDPHPEFDAWRWAALADLPALAVPFKRPIYTILASSFSRFAAP